MKRQFTLIVVVLMVVVLGLGSGMGFCQEDPIGDAPNGALEMQPMDRDAFGGDYQTLVIPAAAFTPQGELSYGYAGQGYIYRTGGIYNTFWAPVMLPAGAFITLSALYMYDDNATEDITLTWGTYSFPVSDDPYYHLITSATKDTSTGYTYMFFLPNTIIRYYADMDGDGSDEATAYRITVKLPATNSSLRFGGVELNWKRMVSPAPATATFNDVPVGHWAFQFVEALAASGITAGCGGDNFCPDDTVTRAQMAVYLSAALGLHYPN